MANERWQGPNNLWPPPKASPDYWRTTNFQDRFNLSE